MKNICYSCLIIRHSLEAQEKLSNFFNSFSSEIKLSCELMQRAFKNLSIQRGERRQSQTEMIGQKKLFIENYTKVGMIFKIRNQFDFFTNWPAIIKYPEALIMSCPRSVSAFM